MEHTVFQLEPRLQLTFCEVYILQVNMRHHDHSELIARLDLLLRNTQDAHLRIEAEQLLRKVMALTPSEFTRLQQDTQAEKILFPPGYTLNDPS